MQRYSKSIYLHQQSIIFNVSKLLYSARVYKFRLHHKNDKTKKVHHSVHLFIRMTIEVTMHSLNLYSHQTSIVQT